MNTIKLPQPIDPHVHFRTPGMEHKENWRTGTTAAVAGGYTTVLEMPNTKPPMLTRELLEAKRTIAARDTACLFGLIFGSSVDNIKEIKQADGYAAVKIFFNLSTGNMKIDDESVLKDIFSNTHLVVAHAEGEQLEKAIWLAEKSGTPLYVAHIPGAAEIAMIKKAKQSLPVYAEVTPHHLFLEKPENADPFRMMMPALRGKQDQETLWAAIEDGTIDTLGTDHAPHTVAEKQELPPPFGVPGLETALPLMLHAVNQKRLSIERLIELIHTNPLKIFNIKPAGNTYCEADLELRKTVDNATLFTKCGWSPFHNWELTGWPVKTVINGVTVFENGKLVDANQGREVSYELFN